VGDGASRDRGEQGGRPAGRHPRIDGRRLAVGAHGRARLAWLLGLDRTPGRWRVTSAAWIEDHVEISVAVGGGREVVFVVERPGSGEGAFVATGDLALRYRGKTLPPSLARWVQAAAERRLSRITMERIVEVLCSDPDLGKEGLPQPASASHPAQQIDTWGGDDTWAEFFARGEISRGQLDSIDPTKLFRFVQHCDAECLEVSPWGLVPTVSLVNYPWADRARTMGRRRDVPATQDDDGEVGQMMASDLDEQDVILGNPGKLRDLLEHAVAQEDPRGRIIFFSNTCVPTVTGEDVESVVREYRQRCAVPLVYLTVTPKAMTDVFRDLLVERRLRAEAAAGPPDPRAVNLIGFPDDRATGELVELLGRFGVRVHVLLLPDLDLERIERLPGAALNVFRPNQVWAHYYDQLREGSRIAHIAPCAPFGRTGTRRWLEAVLGGLAIPLDDDTFRAAAAADDPAWERAAARAASHRIGLVVRGDEVHYLTDPANTWGVPLLEFTREAGLGLDLMLHARDAASGRALVDQTAGGFEPGPSWTIHMFKSFDELEALLDHAGCEAVLSHYFFDWRLTQAGKNAFSLQHFEMGVGGGARTLERLVRACEMPFYRRYRSFLRRTREGLRAPERPQ
jgi:hypothetical protein